MATLGIGPGRLLLLRGLPLRSFHTQTTTFGIGQCSPGTAWQLSTSTLVAQMTRQRTRRAPPASSRSYASNNSGRRPHFHQRLGHALWNTRIQWYQIPIWLGVGLLGLLQLYKVTAREREKQREEIQDGQSERNGRPKKRPRVRPEGPW